MFDWNSCVHCININVELDVYIHCLGVDL